MLEHPSLDLSDIEPRGGVQVRNAPALPFGEPVKPVKAAKPKAKEKSFSKLLPILMSRWTVPQGERQRQP
jgi:hypothetical protein